MAEISSAQVKLTAEETSILGKLNNDEVIDLFLWNCANTNAITTFTVATPGYSGEYVQETLDKLRRQDEIVANLLRSRGISASSPEYKARERSWTHENSLYALTCPVKDLKWLTS